MVRSLLAAGANPTLRNFENATPYDYCKSDAMKNAYTGALMQAVAQSKYVFTGQAQTYKQTCALAISQTLILFNLSSILCNKNSSIQGSFWCTCLALMNLQHE